MAQTMRFSQNVLWTMHPFHTCKGPYITHVHVPKIISKFKTLSCKFKIQSVHCCSKFQSSFQNPLLDPFISECHVQENLHVPPSHHHWRHAYVCPFHADPNSCYKRFIRVKIHNFVRLVNTYILLVSSGSDIWNGRFS